MKRIFLFRHPHVSVAEEGICYGASEVKLSQEGESQAQDIVNFLGQYELDAVYASDLSRAAQPAQLVADYHEVELQLVPHLREVHCGDWEGLKYTQIQECDPELYQAWFSLDGSFSFPGGENISDFRDRVLEIFREIVEDGLVDGDSNIAVITHAGVARIILMNLLGMPWKAAWQLGQDFAAVNVIDYYEDGGVTLQLLNGSC